MTIFIFKKKNKAGITYDPMTPLYRIHIHDLPNPDFSGLFAEKDTIPMKWI